MIKRLLKQKKGMTLIEAIVSTALLTLVVTLLVSVFTSSINIIRINAEMKRASRDAAAGIENQMAGIGPDNGVSITQQQAGTFVIQFNGVTVSTGGNLVESTDTDGDVKFYYFVPN